MPSGLLDLDPYLAWGKSLAGLFQTVSTDVVHLTPYWSGGPYGGCMPHAEMAANDRTLYGLWGWLGGAACGGGSKLGIQAGKLLDAVPLVPCQVASSIYFYVVQDDAVNVIVAGTWPRIVHSLLH